MQSMARSALLIVALATLTGCGGGGGGGGAPLGGNPGLNPPPTNSGYTQGVFSPSSTFANQCASPRAGTSDRSGSAFTESMFLRSWTNETYLWYSEVPDTNPSGIATLDYFDTLKTTALTASGNDKDRFHFTYSTEEWRQLSESGIQVGYGAQWVLIPQSQANPRVMTAFVEPGYAATQQGVIRGTEVLAADGIVVANIRTESQVEQLYAALFPVSANEQHSFTIRDANGTQRQITMNSTSVTYTPVPTWSVINQPDGPVGYLLFNDHIQPAERQLVDAINALGTANVRDLVLDLRYNGGGYLDIANELAYMIANTTRTAGRTFERLMFNDKYTTTDPVGRPIGPTPFHSTAQGFSVTEGTPLPSLNLERVYILSSSNTCSASESIINSLRGVDVQVYLIGETTCGKPYGFYPEENCGTTYFSIQFEGRNAKDFGNYPDGFVPGSADSGSTVRGCRAADDLSRQLGDPLEGRLQAALDFRASNNQICPSTVSVAPKGSSSKAAVASFGGVMVRSPMRENRILRDELRNSLSF